MATDFLSLDEAEQQELILRAALASGRSPSILEKDLWVCWVLSHLFPVPAGWPVLTFKGGTSLSKVFNAISRFSEDVDVTVDYHGLGLPGDVTAPGLSANAVKKLLEAHDEALTAFVAGTLTPFLQSRIHAAGTTLLSGCEFAMEHGEATTVVRYRSLFDTTRPAYLQDTVRLEFGARNPVDPHEIHAIGCDIGRFLADARFSFPNATGVRVLSPSRTFWEKATILHAEYHRAVPREHADRQSRHWSDLAILSEQAIGTEALRDIGMLESVAKHKQTFFRSAWASYGTARPGTLRLVPNPAHMDIIKQDYEQMIRSEMFYEQPWPFERVLAALTALESRVNSQSS